MQYKTAYVGQVRAWFATYTANCQHLFWTYCDVRGLTEQSEIMVAESDTQVFIVDSSRNIVGNELIYDKIPWSTLDRKLHFYLVPPEFGWNVVYNDRDSVKGNIYALFRVSVAKPWVNAFSLYQLEYLVLTLGDDKAMKQLAVVVDHFAKGEIEIRVKAQSIIISAYNPTLWPNCEAPTLRFNAVTRLGHPIRLEGI